MQSFYFKYACKEYEFSSVTQTCPTLWPHGLQHARLPCPPLSPRICSSSCPLSQGCYLTILSSATPFSSYLQSFPVSQLFIPSGQNIGDSASASVLPMNIQGWSPLRSNALISEHSKGLSRVFSSTIQKHQIFGTHPSLWSNSHIYTWLLEKHSFDYTDLWRPSDVSAF